MYQASDKKRGCSTYLGVLLLLGIIGGCIYAAINFMVFSSNPKRESTRLPATPTAIQVTLSTDLKQYDDKRVTIKGVLSGTYSIQCDNTVFAYHGKYMCQGLTLSGLGLALPGGMVKMDKASLGTYQNIWVVDNAGNKVALGQQLRVSGIVNVLYSAGNTVKEVLIIVDTAESVP